MFPLRLREMLSISSDSSTPPSTIATRLSSSWETLISMTFDMISYPGRRAGSARAALRASCPPPCGRKPLQGSATHEGHQSSPPCGESAHPVILLLEGSREISGGQRL